MHLQKCLNFGVHFIIYESSLFCCSVGLGYCPTEFVHTNAMLVLNRNRYDYKFTDKNNNYFSAGSFLRNA